MSHIHLWHHLAACMFWGPAVREQQQAAWWITRPPLFINTKVLRGVLIALGVLLSSSVACVLEGLLGRVALREERRRLVRRVGCFLRSRGGRVWRCGLGTGQAHRQASPLSPLQLLATSPTPLTHKHAHKYTGCNKLASLWSQQTTLWICVAFLCSQFSGYVIDFCLLLLYGH